MFTVIQIVKYNTVSPVGRGRTQAPFPLIFVPFQFQFNLLTKISANLNLWLSIIQLRQQSVGILCIW